VEDRRTNSRCKQSCTTQLLIPESMPDYPDSDTTSDTARTIHHVAQPLMIGKSRPFFSSDDEAFDEYQALEVQQFVSKQHRVDYDMGRTTKVRQY